VAACAAPLLQLRVLWLGFFQDEDIGVGILPERKEIFVAASARTRAASESALLEDEVWSNLNLLAPESTICLVAADRLRRPARIENHPSQGGTVPMKRAALYCHVSTIDQHPEAQLGELCQFAAHKGFQIVGEFTDHGFSGTPARRPELDRMMDDARRYKFDVLLVWSCDRLARSTKHLLQTIDELNESSFYRSARR
jgi:hypothetical protein